MTELISAPDIKIHSLDTVLASISVRSNDQNSKFPRSVVFEYFRSLSARTLQLGHRCKPVLWFLYKKWQTGHQKALQFPIGTESDWKTWPLVVITQMIYLQPCRFYGTERHVTSIYSANCPNQFLWQMHLNPGGLAARFWVSLKLYGVTSDGKSGREGCRNGTDQDDP